MAEVVRSGLTESRHRGAVAGLAADGSGHQRRPDDVPVLPRSANKPLQAAAMLRCGLRLDGELLALAAEATPARTSTLTGCGRSCPVPG